MLQARNIPVDNYKSPVELACVRKLWSILPLSPNNLTVKPVDNDEFKQERWNMKSSKRSIMIKLPKELRSNTVEKHYKCLEMGNRNQQLLLKNWVKQKLGVCTDEIENTYCQKKDEDQTIEM